MTLSSKALVAHMTVGTWLGMRVDPSQSSAVRRVQERLIPKPAFKGVITALGALRTHFYGHTIPWKDNGDRLLPTALFVPVMREHLALKHAFDETVERFVTDIYQPARHRVHNRIDPADWPEPDDLRQRFRVDLVIDTVAAPDGFDLGDERINAAVRAKLTAAYALRVSKAQIHVWERLEAEVAHYSERMLSSAIFRDSLLKHLAETIELAPAFNLLDDPELTSLATLELPCLLEPGLKQLRCDPLIRAAAGATAQKYLARIRHKIKELSQ